MGVPFNLTPALWESIWLRVVARALELTNNKQRALDLAQSAILDALDPERHPWSPARDKPLVEFLCDRVWSDYGNEIQSYRSKKASEPLEDEPEVEYGTDPLRMLLKKEEEVRVGRLYTAIEEPIKADAPIQVLLEDDTDDGPPLDEKGNVIVALNAEAASTRRARARGYSDKDIEAARKRLRRIAIKARREDDEKFPK